MKKSKSRIFLRESISSNLIIYIQNKQHHFLKNVLRAKIDDFINVFDGSTGEWKSKIIAINRNNTVLRILKNIRKMKYSSDIWLVLAPIKPQRMALSIQKATELGVSKIIPCFTEYTDIRNVNILNLKSNAIEAAEQSERLDIPIIEKPDKIESLLVNWPEDRKLIYCDEKNKEGKSIIQVLNNLKFNFNKIAVLIGPEGGFSESEKKLLIGNKNIISVSLGARLLRSDTAATVSLFCIQELIKK